MKIIVVDDEPIIADTLVNILEGEGHDALAVSHGESAVKWAKLVVADAVISDVIMPGMDGIETAKAISLSSLDSVLLGPPRGCEF